MTKCERFIVRGCASLLLIACGDDAGRGSGSASDSASSLPSTLSTTLPTSSASDSGMTEGSGSATATATSGPTSTTGESATGTDATTNALTDALTDGPTATTVTPPPSCGDGQVDVGEACDLGPLNGPDNGCSTECEVLATSCGTQEAGAELVPKPVDIIIAIDNSGSMGDEIVGVQDNINNNFAQIIEDSGLDYRVILVAKFGNDSSESVCIEAPLGGIPQGGCTNPPGMAVNGERFFHYSTEVSSHDSWCKLLRTFDGALADDFGFAPTGWSEWLRPDAFKVFLELTDDGVSCSYDNKAYNDGNNVNGGMTAATTFDEALRATDPLHFGETIEDRNYKWYSIVGMAYNNPPEAPYTELDPIVTGECPSAADNGTGYQALSNMTGALRFPLCDTTKYDVVFQAIAAGVVADAKIACDFEIPPPPEDKTLDEDSIVVLFTPSGQMDPIILTKVPGPDQCDPMSFYVEDGKVILCPAACTLAQDDKDAELKVEFSCDPLVPN